MMEYTAVGLMSGTSLDGLDIACCKFIFKDGGWHYSVLQAETIPYPASWINILSALPEASAEEYVYTDHLFGHYIGKLTADFLNKHSIRADFISSHGHTVFHQPSRGFTAQIGHGAAIRSEVNLPVICDFRTGDVANGGQGAPLVPAGDKLLFPEYDYCLNLGGFANISCDAGMERIAFDICPVNIVLNELALREGMKFDKDGTLAASGQTDPILLGKLNELEFYSQSGPKSLGKEWVVEYIFPLLQRSGLNTRELLNTFCTHISMQISRHTGNEQLKKVLVTGGGTHNKYLVSKIQSQIRPKLIIPDVLTLDFKEAIIFAFLGVLRKRDEINCLKTVTGAKQDGSYGANY